MLWPLAIAFGVALGLAGGGNLSNLARLKFRWPLLLVAAVALRYIVIFSPLSKVEGAQYAYAVSLAGIVLWTVWHLRLLPGVWLVTLGGALNLIVVLPNGGSIPLPAFLGACPLSPSLSLPGRPCPSSVSSAHTRL